VVTGAALAPDLDLLGRFWDGGNHHQGATHSFGGALLVAALVWALSDRHLGTLAGIGWSSHVLLDCLGRDTSPPIGLMALWPLDTGYHKSQLVVFLDVGRSMTWDTLWRNALAVAWECVLLLPILYIVERARSRSR